MKEVVLILTNIYEAHTHLATRHEVGVLEYNLFLYFYKYFKRVLILWSSYRMMQLTRVNNICDYARVALVRASAHAVTRVYSRDENVQPYSLRHDGSYRSWQMVTTPRCGGFLAQLKIL